MLELLVEIIIIKGRLIQHTTLVHVLFAVRVCVFLPYHFNSASCSSCDSNNYRLNLTREEKIIVVVENKTSKLNIEALTHYLV